MVKNLDSLDMENNDEDKQVPLTKPKRVMSEKQKENFKKAQEKRAESIKLKKEQKILEAQKALLEKEGIIENKKLSDDNSIENKKEVKQIKQKAIKINKEPTIKKQIIFEESSTEEDDLESSQDESSDEEILIIKKSKKTKQPKQNIKEKVNKIPPVKNVVQRPVQQNLNDWSKYFL